MELGSYFLFLQEQTKDIIIIITSLHIKGQQQTRVEWAYEKQWQPLD